MKRIIDFSDRLDKQMFERLKTVSDNVEIVYNRITSMQMKIIQWQRSGIISEQVMRELEEFIMDLKFYHQIEAGKTEFNSKYKGKLSGDKRKAKSNDWKTMFLDFKKNKKGHLQKLVDAFKALHPKAPGHLNTYKTYLGKK